MRGFSIFEHDCYLDYDINLDENNKYYESFKSSDVLGTTCKFETDGNGFLKSFHSSDKAGYNIYFMGDSTVECSFVQPEYRFPYLVGKIMQESDFDKINTYNCGVSGADTLSIMKVLLMKVFPLNPDMVFLCNTDRELVYLLSDNSADLRHTKGATYGKKRIIEYRDWIWNASIKRRALVAFNILFRAKHFAPCNTEEEHYEDSLFKMQRMKDASKVLITFEKDLEAFVSLCIARNIMLVLATQANRYNDLSNESMREAERLKKLYENAVEPIIEIEYTEYIKIYKEANDVVRKIAKKYGVFLIDLEKWKNENENSQLLYDFVHYSNSGSKAAAQYISEELTNFLK